MQIDILLTQALYDVLPRTQFTNELALFFSQVGWYMYVWVIFLVWLAVVAGRSRKHFLLIFILTLVTTQSMVFSAKILFERERPCHVKQFPTTVDNSNIFILKGKVYQSSCLLDYSFPSGHAAHAFALASIFGRVFTRYCLWLYSIAVMVAVSRVYLGMHYVLDIVVGAVLGFAISYICFILVEQTMRKK